MSDYERIKRACLKREELWEDPEFPATQTSVFYHQTPPFQFTWKRPKEVCNRPTFIEDEPGQFDITAGKMGDKWLVSCLGVLCLSKGLLYRAVPADQGFRPDQYAGVFRFRLWWCGEWTEVLVDDRLPTVNGRLAFLHCTKTDQFWPALLEKAYAKLHGSYEALKYGSLLDGLADLTGGITESISLETESASRATCVRLLSQLLERTSVVTCVLHMPQHLLTRAPAEKLSSGIHWGINYRIYAIEKVQLVSGETVHLVRLRNPFCASGDFRGRWRPNGPEWDTLALGADGAAQLLHTTNAESGEFWMACEDLERHFTELEVVHLDAETSRDEPSLLREGAWQLRAYQSFWQRGLSAGGCRNNMDTFHINPQLLMTLTDPEEVVISLNQHSIMEPKVIGFTIYSLGAKPPLESVGKAFFKKTKSLTNSQYTNSRQVSQRCQLEAGAYLVLPTTFDAGQESGFTFRAYSSRAVRLKLLDTQPSLLRAAVVKAPAVLDAKNFSQYEAVFLQLADEHKTVNAFELQELLDACLPNDYIKSCASIEVCRQVILTLDTSGSGRLKFADFKDLMCSLKHWQVTFKNHTKEKTGILKAERFRDALLDVGFQLNTEVLAILMMRYMRKDGTMRFGDYVAAILHLCVAFNIFENRDSLQNGNIKLTLSEWLKSSLMS